MNRRTLLTSLAAAAVAPRLVGAQELTGHPLENAFAAWKAEHLAADGRVVDVLQQGASHSESQCYGLLLAATLGDAEAFDRIDGWTMTHLALRRDRLLAWRWLPDGRPNVPDRNNASDGDLFHAWALVRAAARLNRPELVERAAGIARDLAAACILPRPDAVDGVVFTPAAEGFLRGDQIVLNPSYAMPLAMREVALATGVQVLAQAADDSDRLIATLAEAGLVPDWVTIGPTGMAPAEGKSFQNGYEALRVAPFLVWSGQATHPAVTRQAAAYARASEVGESGTPTVMDRLTMAVVERSPDPGYLAIATLLACAADPLTSPGLPRFVAQQPYYPATLHLFTMLAQIETAPQCQPF
jgi:endoglucanase